MLNMFSFLWVKAVIFLGFVGGTTSLLIRIVKSTRTYLGYKLATYTTYRAPSVHSLVPRFFLDLRLLFSTYNHFPHHQQLTTTNYIN